MDRFKGIMMIIGGLALIFLLAIPQYKISTSPAQDIYEINADEIVEGTHISGNVDFIYDYYAMESKEEKTLGITTSTENDTARWYIFPVYGENTEVTRLLTLRISPKDYYTMDKIVDETWAYLDGKADTFGQTTYAIDVRAVKMDDELHQLYYDWYGADVSKEEADAYLTPYVLVPVMEPNMLWLIVGISALLIIVGLVLVLKREKKQEEPQPASAAAYDNANPTEMRMDAYNPESYRPESYDPDERYTRYEEK